MKVKNKQWQFVCVFFVVLFSWGMCMFLWLIVFKIEQLHIILDMKFKKNSINVLKLRKKRTIK